MREAFELSYACAMMFAKTRVQLIAMDELAFKHPVPIGSILEYSAQVTFTETTGEGQVIHVEVGRVEAICRSLRMSWIPRRDQERRQTRFITHLSTPVTPSSKSFHNHMLMRCDT